MLFISLFSSEAHDEDFVSRQFNFHVLPTSLPLFRESLVPDNFHSYVIDIRRTFGIPITTITQVLQIDTIPISKNQESSKLEHRLFDNTIMTGVPDLIGLSRKLLGANIVHFLHLSCKVSLSHSCYAEIPIVRKQQLLNTRNSSYFVFRSPSPNVF